MHRKRKKYGELLNGGCIMHGLVRVESSMALSHTKGSLYKKENHLVFDWYAWILWIGWSMNIILDGCLVWCDDNFPSELIFAIEKNAFYFDLHHTLLRLNQIIMSKWLEY